jgi:hypothetical protein
MRKYSFPVGRSVKIITLLTYLLLLILFYWFYIFKEIFSPIFALVTISVFVIIAITYVYTPKEIILENDRLVIKRVIGKVEIPYKQIREVSYLEKLKSKIIRLFGSGGLYGWFGIFYVSEIGKVHMYARRMSNFVLIKADKNYLLSPENPKEFVKNLKSLLKQK